MNLNNLIDNIFKDFENSKESIFNFYLNENNYEVQIKLPRKTDNFNLPYILIIPQNINENSLMAVETNNLETSNEKEILSNGLTTAYKLLNNLTQYNCPVLIPIIPSIKNGPYFQQLSKECFELDENNPLFRIDMQIKNIIENAKNIIFEKKQVTINDKIFLNGYSSSGVFAQRFALLHPEIIHTLCVGGASGSIPMPDINLKYPLGIADYNQITGKNFDFENYQQIVQRYYIGSLEDKSKSMNRYDEDGNYAPMHDMSYFNRSVPNTTGYNQRITYGKNLFERSEKQISILSKLGLNISQEIFEGRTHNNIDGIGVNELKDNFINKTYEEASININKYSNNI